MRLFSCLATLLFLASPALAHGISQGDIEIIHPNIPAPAASAKSAAGYMAISNAGAAPDRLLAVETAFARSAQLHSSETGADGVARMQHLPEGVVIPAGDTIVLEPGGMHLMLMGLAGKVAEGDMVPATLVFEHAGRVEIEFMIDPPGGMDHSQMDYSGMAAGAAMPGHAHGSN